jgi:integrase
MAQFQLDKIELFGGDIKIYRTPNSGKIWQLRIWIREEQKYFQKSLRTGDVALARQLAEEAYLDILSKRRAGLSVFGKTFYSVIEDWLESQENEVGFNKKASRIVTIKSQIKWIKRFLSDPNRKISDIRSTEFRRYFSFRRTHAPEVSNSTLRNEQATINAIFRYALSHGYITHVQMPEFIKLTATINRRNAVSLDDYRIITNFMRTNKYIDNDDPLCVTHFVRDFTLVLANSGIRFNEARQLRWRNVKVVRNSESKYESVAELSLDAEMTKNYRARKVQAMRGDVFDRIKTYSKFTKPNDYVFVHNESGEQLSRDRLYRIWRKTLVDCGLDKSEYPITFYCLRHSYATWRLYAGVTPYVLAKNMGTSLTNIQNHYEHLDMAKLRDELTGPISNELKILLSSSSE